ncbi:hypothetical protein C1632_10485 [Microbacterium testaceum]|nr:hypothetical protein C1632_10485 [Microbacterium testaceum]
MGAAHGVGRDGLAGHDPFGARCGVEVPRVDDPRFERRAHRSEDRPPRVDDASGRAQCLDDALPQGQEEGVAGVIDRAREVFDDGREEVGCRDVEAEGLAATQFRNGGVGQSANRRGGKVRGHAQPGRFGDRADVVIGHQGRVLGERGESEHRLERVQTREANSGNEHHAGAGRKRSPQLRGAEREAAVVVADGLRHEEGRPREQSVQTGRFGGVELVHGGDPHGRQLFGGDDEPQGLGLAVADDDAVAVGGGCVAEELGVVDTTRYHRVAVVRKACRACPLRTHDVNVSVGVVVVPTAPLHCDVPGDAVRAPSRTQSRGGEKIVVTPIRVAAVPSAHPYVAAIADPHHVRVLADPPPPGAPAGQWWPPQVLLPAWLEANVEDFDLVHVHFGIESYSPAELEDTVATLRRLGRPLVYTVHDLENPQLSAQDEHRASLAVLAAAADELITLTDTAGAEVHTIAHRATTVIPHPTLLGDDPRPTGSAHDTTRVGVHLRDLRPNIDGVGTTATLVRAISDLRAQGARVEAVVRVNERVRDEEAAASIDLLVAGTEGVRVERGPRLDDDALARWLADLDACVLPYRHGTQSGWAELCYDLAVPVIGTRIGHIAAQHPDDFHTFDVGEPVSLARAILDATHEVWSTPGSARREGEVLRRRSERSAELEDVRSAHLAVYRRVLAAEVAA